MHLIFCAAIAISMVVLIPSILADVKDAELKPCKSSCPASAYKCTTGGVKPRCISGKCLCYENQGTGEDCYDTKECSKDVCAKGKKKIASCVGNDGKKPGKCQCGECDSYSDCGQLACDENKTKKCSKEGTPKCVCAEPVDLGR